jgi:hypothetical protein
MAAKEGKYLVIPPPNMKEAIITVKSKAPLVMNKFSQKAREEYRQQQELGEKAKNKKKKEPKDFNAMYEGSIHYAAVGRDADPWIGIPAPAFRNAMIDACRTAGFVMTKAKMTIFVEEDGYGEDGTPLVMITEGAPKHVEHIVRNATGVIDIRARAMWEYWEAELHLTWDGDQFGYEDVCNLLMRAGLQVGLLEGRPFSKNSAGMGWGTFKLGDLSDQES